jgi:ubiquinone biosynthesis protein
MKSNSEILARFNSLGDLFLLILGLVKIVAAQAIDGTTGKLDSTSLSEQRRELALWLKNELVKRGPLYIKIGQVISTRPDIFYSEWIDELSTLQDDAPPVPFDEIRKVIENELGKPISELFISLEETPLATASIAQVHKGLVLDNGEIIEVAVKVQKPGVEKKILTDLKVIRSIVQHIGILLPRLTKGTDINGTIIELENTFGRELDYTQELSAVRILRRNFSDSKIRSVFPAEYERLSSRKVLTERYVSSTKLTQFTGSAATAETIIRIIVRSFLKQFFIDGFFHADPHPGNLGYKIDAAGPYLVFYDLGLNCSLSPPIRTSLSKLIGLIINQDTEGILDECTAMGIITQEARQDADVRKGIYAFIDAIPSSQLSLTGIGQLRQELLEVSEKGEVQIPAELTFMGRTIVILEGTFAMFQAMHPGLDLGNIVVSEALPILKDIIGTSDGILERATNDLQRTLNLLWNISLTSRKIFLDIERGTVKLPVSTPETDRSLRRLKAGVKSTNAAIIGGTFFVSGSITLAFGPRILGVPLIFASLFAFERWLIAEKRMER